MANSSLFSGLDVVDRLGQGLGHRETVDKSKSRLVVADSFLNLLFAQSKRPRVQQRLILCDLFSLFDNLGQLATRMGCLGLTAQIRLRNRFRLLKVHFLVVHKSAF